MPTSKLVNVNEKVTFDGDRKRRSSKLRPFPVGVVGGCIVVT